MWYLFVAAIVVMVGDGARFWLVKSSGGLSVVQVEQRPPNAVASATYNTTFSQTGWDYLHVQASPNASGTYQAYYYGGYLEGFVTAAAITTFYESHNSYASMSAKVKAWVDAHMAYLDAQTANPKDSFWLQVGAQLQQLRGLAAGYTASGRGTLSYADVFHFNFRYELGDVIGAVSLHGAARDMSLRRRQHCSALIKVTPTELFSSQITWSGYGSMVRQYKVYEFNSRVSFTGYALQIHSGDDWYITSNGLSTQETTNDYYFEQLARMFVKPASVSEFLRVMAANYMAKSGDEWVRTFVTNHSGTYCNQYMVVDYKRYTPGDAGWTLREGLLWVVEEMPGDYEYGDVTDVLRKTGYWASYNIPYFDRIYLMSGFESMYLRYGDFFSYTRYARPRLFKARQGSVTNMASMMYMMQYNHFRTDAESIITNCTGCDPAYSPLLTIASRGDLVPQNASLPLPNEMIPFYARNAFGATDAKITSSSLMSKAGSSEAAFVFCGPTPQQGPFRWSHYGAQPPPGAPDLYNFSWVRQQAQSMPW